MITIKRILCPTDFSEFSDRALRHAIALARWYGSTITAFHAHHEPPPPPTKLPAYPIRPKLSPEFRERLLKHLDDSLEPARSAAIPVEVALAEGDPVGEILKQAESMRADLMVLGTHGRGGFERLVLGSVAEKVLRKARCPVLTVPRKAGTPAAGEPVAFKRILCPVDFSESSLRALEYGFSLAKEANARITLLHAIEPFAEEEPPELLRFDVTGFRKRLLDDARERLGRFVPQGVRDWCEPELLVAPGKAYRVILREAEERETDLIVIGVVGRGALDRMLFGSTTQHVVRQATCPVLTIRHG